MYYLGQTVLLKKGLRYIRGVVIEIDTDFITLNLDYKRCVGTKVRVSKDSKDLIKFDFKTKELFKGNTEAFNSNNNNDFMI